MATIELTAGVTGKPRELQGFLNRIVYHPAARRLAALLAPTPVTPNMVSVAGAAMVVAAGILYAIVGGALGIALGFALHVAWHVVDGADGDLARMTGRASPIGEVVDGLCDYGGHLVLYLLLGALLDDTFGWVAWVLAVGAGLSRVVQSVFAESSRRTYQWWAYGVSWLGQNRAAQGGIGAAGRLYVWISEAVTGPTQRVNALVASAEHDPIERRRIAMLAREAGRSTLPLQQALGANPRTIILGVSMIAGSPLWFFLVEIVVLNAVLTVAFLQQAASCRRLVGLIARGRE
ncbi:CDP-alcohol phosphatidyltransferase family protein [Sphingomonas sp. SUN019]|uniref:CDP-alcohol phosphatidyltransferase family protein n=1 Tax=Sphingomonas sp. SUN019 TaxID=2937788 RepID=UPI0021644EDB|nr:CDP-alcohol phosphatidyltransferase family protein [Sphingomonas sp. SUN019]UVO50395.1 CDP-alcohol phosphatidyltransferase family protein [Sphingomonas sp. SUN019]